ncbi:MAG: winged helix-turn-helix transcriptional regulator, partial [Acidobacteria bacterium]|nr:winged helix-turn-helix transcriptional regulator [Acidobacteriota bacterium]
MESSPFGAPARTRVLLSLRLMASSYPRELSRLLGLALNGVQGALRSLERDGLVIGRSVGRTRVFELNPRYFAASPLNDYLDKLSAADADLQRRVAMLRRRPRRTG